MVGTDVVELLHSEGRLFHLCKNVSKCYCTYALQESLGEMVASQIGWHSPVVPKQPSAAVCVAKQRTQLTAAIETLTNSCSLKTASLYVYLFVCLLWDCLHCFIPSLL